MKVVAFNGSARKKGNTSILIAKVFETLEKEGVTTEQVDLAGKKIKGCIACFKCFEMFVVGANYPNMALGMDRGDVTKDAQGIQTMEVLGKNMAFLLGRLRE